MAKRILQEDQKLWDKSIKAGKKYLKTGDPRDYAAWEALQPKDLTAKPAVGEGLKSFRAYPLKKNIRTKTPDSVVEKAVKGLPVSPLQTPPVTPPPQKESAVERYLKELRDLQQTGTKAGKAAQAAFAENPLAAITPAVIQDWHEGEKEFTERYGNVLEHLARLKDYSRPHTRDIPYDFSGLQDTLARYTMAGSLGPKAYRPTRTPEAVDREQMAYTTALLEGLQAMQGVKTKGLAQIIRGAQGSAENRILQELIRAQSRRDIAAMRSKGKVAKTNFGNVPIHISKMGGTIAGVSATIGGLFPKAVKAFKYFPEKFKKGVLSLDWIRKLTDPFAGLTDQKKREVFKEYTTSLEASLKPIIRLNEQRISNYDFQIEKGFRLDSTKSPSYNLTKGLEVIDNFETKLTYMIDGYSRDQESIKNAKAIVSFLGNVREKTQKLRTKMKGEIKKMIALEEGKVPTEGMKPEKGTVKTKEGVKLGAPL